MKKVLFISHYAGIGGANLSLLHLINNLQKYEKVSPYVFIPCYGPFENKMKEYGIPYGVHKYMSFRSESRGLLKDRTKGVVMIIVNTLQAIRFSFWIRKNFDVIYANSSKVSFCCFLKFFSGRPLVWHLREFGDVDYPLTFLLGKTISSRFYSYSDRLIAISKRVLEYYRDNVCHDGKYELIYNGIEESNYEQGINTTQNEKLHVCIVGGVDPSKNQEDIINAIQLLHKENIDIYVDIIGNANNSYGSRLQKQCTDSAINNFVTFLGQRDDINKLLPSYDVGVLTSKNEAFGRVIVEYMMAGLTVVATNAGACPELITDGDTGLLYDVGKPADLADKLKTIVNNPSFAREIAKKGKVFAIENFTAKINAHNIANLINQI